MQYNIMYGSSERVMYYTIADHVAGVNNFVRSEVKLWTDNTA